MVKYELPHNIRCEFRFNDVDEHQAFFKLCRKNNTSKAKVLRELANYCVEVDSVELVSFLRNYKKIMAKGGVFDE